MADFLSVALDEAPEVEREVDCGGGFVVTINWLSPSQREEVSDIATQIKRGKIVSNREGVAKKWCKLVVKGWSGLTRDVFFNKLRLYCKPKHAAELEQKFAENGGEYPYSEGAAVAIFLNALPDNFTKPIREAIAEMDEEEREDIARDDRKSA